MIIKSKKDLAKISDLLFTIYHESGHTIYGLLHLMKIDRVCVFESKKTKRMEGLTHFDSPNLSKFTDVDLLSDLLHSEICFRYAGLTAEKHFFNSLSGSNKFPLFLRDGSSDDTMRAAALINQYNLVPSGKKRYSYKRRIINETLHELQLNWDAVIIVAHALFQKRSLDYFELKNLLIKKSKNKEFWKTQFKLIDNIYDNNAHLDEESYVIILHR